MARHQVDGGPLSASACDQAIELAHVDVAEGLNRFIVEPHFHIEEAGLGARHREGAPEIQR